MVQINQEVVIALIVAGSSLLGIVLSKVFEKLISRAGDAAQKEEQHSSGLRLDLSRKDLEISNLRTELRDTDNQLDLLRDKYLKLKEKIYQLRMITYGLLVAAGKTPEEIDQILPPVIDILLDSD